MRGNEQREWMQWVAEPRAGEGVPGVVRELLWDAQGGVRQLRVVVEGLIWKRIGRLKMLLYCLGSEIVG